MVESSFSRSRSKSKVPIGSHYIGEDSKHVNQIELSLQTMLTVGKDMNRVTKRAALAEVTVASIH